MAIHPLRPHSWCVVAVVGLLVALAAPVHAQAAQSLAEVQKLYVGDFTGGGAEQLRKKLIQDLHKSGRFQLVAAAREADAVLSGAGQIWIRGYITTNSRAPSTNKQAVYSGYISAEVTGKDQRALWSYFVTPSKFVWSTITDNLAGNLARKLIEADKGETAPRSAYKANLSQTALRGAGATFPAPLYKEWFQSFEQQNPGVHISYDAVGSEQGTQRLAAGEVDFAGSDVSSPDLGNPLLHAGVRRVASVLGAVVLIYNLPNITQDLKFTPAMLAGIYLGKVRKWNDPEIRRWNKGVDLPDSEIAVVHRSDGSGTTYTFSDYLSKVSPEWQASVGRGTSLNWPAGTGAEKNDGVATAVQNTRNSIGYVEMVYAVQHQLSFGLVRNRSGEFIRPSLDTLATAAKAASFDGPPPSITDAAAKGAYPISTFTWLLLPPDITDAAKKNALYELLRWVLTDGQNDCSALAYAPLPQQVAQRELQSLKDWH